MWKKIDREITHKIRIVKAICLSQRFIEIQFMQENNMEKYQQPLVFVIEETEPIILKEEVQTQQN